MPIQFFRNREGRFDNVTRSTRLPPLRGWWYSLAARDIDEDGRPDLVAGNLGLNHTYTTSRDSTFAGYAAPFTGNQTTDVVLTQEIDGNEYPVAGLAPLGREIYPLGLRFPTYGSFALASIRQLFLPAQLQQALAPVPQPELAHHSLDRAAKQLNDVLGEVRRISHDLRPALLDDLLVLL
jgi:enediyne biosynthesis protein E4